MGNEAGDKNKCCGDQQEKRRTRNVEVAEEVRGREEKLRRRQEESRPDLARQRRGKGIKP
jgi:hypothetical protein